MARYQYTGPGPHVTGGGEISGAILRPGDIREFDEEPAFGPWKCIDPAPEPEPAPVAAPAPFLVPPAPAKEM